MYQVMSFSISKVGYMICNIVLIQILIYVDIVQYKAVIQLPSDFYKSKRRKRQDEDSSQKITNLLNQVYK